MSALLSIRRRHARQYPVVREALHATYLCRRVHGWRVLAQLASDPLGIGQTSCPADVAVRVAKWLFAEQDVTYWHNSGRAMLFDYIRDEGLV